MKLTEEKLAELKAKDAESQATNRAALLLQREKDGLVSVKCGKCGTESVLSKDRPAKPVAKCGACGEALTAKE